MKSGLAIMKSGLAIMKLRLAIMKIKAAIVGFCAIHKLAVSFLFNSVHVRRRERIFFLYEKSV